MLLCYLTPEFDIEKYFKRKEVIEVIKERAPAGYWKTWTKGLKKDVKTLIDKGECHDCSEHYLVFSAGLKIVNIPCIRDEYTTYNLWHPDNEYLLKEIYDLIFENFKSFGDFQSHMLINKLQQ